MKKKFTFRNGIFFKKERRKLSEDCKMVCVARLGKLSTGLSMASGLVNKSGNSNKLSIRTSVDTVGLYSRAIQNLRKPNYQCS